MKKLLALFLMAIICVCAFVACGGSNLEAAVSNLQQLQKDVKESTPADFDVVSKLSINGETYTVAWSVNVTEGVKIVVADNGTVTVDVNEYTDTEISYVLTATITAPNGETATLSFNHKVPIFKELTWAEYMAKEDDEAVVVKGVVTAIFNGEDEKDIYMQDTDGGYYLYKVTAIPEGLEIGMTIRATGLRDTYHGGAQVAQGATVEILDTNKVEITPTDITEIVKNAASAKDEALVNLAGKLVSINGVTVLGQSKSNNTYYEFIIDGIRSYARISTSNNFLTEEETTAFKNAVADNFGKSATVTGCVSVYGNAFYIVPVADGAFSNFTIEERDAAGQVAFEKSLLSAVTTVNTTGTTELQVKGLVYGDVTVTWTIKEATVYASVNDGKLDVILPPTETKIVMVATIACGEATDTVEYEVKLAAAPTAVPEKVEAPVAGEENIYKLYLWQANNKQNLYLTGDMDGYYLALSNNPADAADVFLAPIEGKDGEYYLCYKIGKSVGFISAYAQDNNGKWYYNVKIDDRHSYDNTWKIDTETGALVTVLPDKDGNPTTVFLGTYSTYTTMSLSTMDKLSTNFPATFCTLKDIATVPAADKVATTKDEITVPAEITKDGVITLPQIGKNYSNVTITWASDNDCIVVNGGTLTVTVPAEKATVTLTATITCGDVTETATYTVEVYIPKLTPAEIVDKAYELENGASMADQTLTGTIIKIKTAYNASFDNIEVIIVVDGKYDKPILCYRMKGGEGLAVGDTITVTGTIKNYNGTIEFDAKCTYENVQTPADLWEATNAVANKQYLNDTFYTFTGEIVSVDEVYNAQYKNVTVTIKIGEKTFKCYRLAGEGADVIKVGDVITVTGKLQNYNGVQIANGQIKVYPKAMTEAEILAAAAALASGQSLNGTHSLTGEIVSIDTEYSAQYNNITVTIKIGEVTMQCYRMVGGEGLAVGDTITVTGEIKNHNGNIQFNTGATYVEAEA